MSFIPRQYSRDYRHEHERKNNMLHLLCQTILSVGQSHAFLIFFLPNFAHNLCNMYCNLIVTLFPKCKLTI